jgi:hypothetical protein
VRVVVLLVLAAGVLLLSPGASATQPATADVYGGLGSWVDIFAGKAWQSPAAVTARLRAEGIRTLYVETSNSSQSRDIVHPAALGRFVDSAHANGLKIVAWYLPSLARPALDTRRTLAAIRFRSATGQTFDSFALDIEASVVHPVARRNTRLLALARALRHAAPAGYPLGAIIPSPVGMQRHPHYWPHFPFAGLARTFDTFLPMAYFTYYARTPTAAYAYARDVVLAIRSETGRPGVPIHLIGGIASRAPVAAVGGFVQAASDCGVQGLSLYAYFQTSNAEWARLRGATLDAEPLPTCE